MVQSRVEDNVETNLLVLGISSQLSDGSMGYFAAVDDMNEPFIISAESFNRIYPRPEVLIATKVVDKNHTQKEG